MSTDTDLFGYTYEPVDDSEIPVRQRPTTAGRRSSNPHGDRVKALAGTEDASAFRLPMALGAPEAEVKRVVSRHTRWLRQAAHEQDRGVRVWSKIIPETGELKIYFKDIAYKRRARQDDSQPSLFEGDPDQ